MVKHGTCLAGGKADIWQLLDLDDSAVVKVLDSGIRIQLLTNRQTGLQPTRPMLATLAVKT